MDDGATSLTWMVTVAVPLPPALVVWQAPTNTELVLMATIGAGLSVGHTCLIHGLRVGEATAVMPFDYTRLIFAGLAGYIFFFEVPARVKRRKSARGRGLLLLLRLLLLLDGARRHEL